METPLATLTHALRNHLDDNPQRRPVGGMSLFHCSAPQSLRAVPLHQPTAVLIVSGNKEALLGTRTLTIESGELLLPAGATLELANRPGNGTFLSIAVGFSSEAVEQFRRHYASPLRAWANPPLWHANAPATFLQALTQWFDWCRHHPLDNLLIQHRQTELLLLLAQAGLAGNLLLAEQPSWRQRVYQLLNLDLARPWQAAEVSRRLGIGQSTLRRLLADEGSGFRELLEEARLVAGLALLQETFWPVGQVAAAVGYQSQSRFSERFKQRFGLTPLELRQTRLSVCGEPLSA